MARGWTLYRSYENEYSGFPQKISFQMTQKLAALIQSAQAVLILNPDMASIKINYDGDFDPELVSYGLGTTHINVHRENWWFEVYGKFDSSCYAEYNTEKPEEYEEEE